MTQTPHAATKQKRIAAKQQSSSSSKKSGSGTKMATKEARRQLQRHGRKVITDRIT